MLQLVLCTIPKEHANAFAKSLVSAKLAACVNILPSIKSIYHWNDNIEEEEESLLLIKSWKTKIPALIQKMETEHPYDVPEILCISPSSVNESYSSWVKNYVKED